MTGNPPRHIASDVPVPQGITFQPDIYPKVLMYPFFALSIRRALLGKKYADRRELHERHIRWMLKPANLMGRITIAVARRVT